ncbi:hypothetical protein BD289DRAFT_247016 [Coniella lustricola]|uniref:Mid2 domain-containing protein n=1 Tax=Coniella lustricola TaxID=2025994 RepID=A0A2T3A918_9PEZI|nr:hypothetical protein BD289DRAFT_247016 [Coniella lustricola]
MTIAAHQLKCLRIVSCVSLPHTVLADCGFHMLSRQFNVRLEGRTWPGVALGVGECSFGLGDLSSSPLLLLYTMIGTPFLLSCVDCSLAHHSAPHLRSVPSLSLSLSSSSSPSSSSFLFSTITMRPQRLLATISWLLFTTLVDSTCYNVDGTTTDLDNSFQPCNASARYSACCATNKGAQADVCLTSGLCYTQGQGYSGMIYMNGCTDKTGKAANCPHFCPDATTNWGGGSTVRQYNILQCNQGVYCCRSSADRSNCCNNASAIISTDVGRLLLATATLTSTVSTGTAASTFTITSLPSEQTNSDSGSSVAGNATCPADRTTIVGGAVGGALGAALLASLGALAYVLVRNRTLAAGAPHSYNQSMHGTRDGSQMTSLASPQPYVKARTDMQGRPAVIPCELPVEQSRVEM